LNVIPQLLIERVEIITGGTSAVYGSDALAGVVNFITRKDHSGFDAEAGFSVTEEGDAKTYDLGLTYGHNFAEGRGNLTAYVSGLERKSLLAGEREFTSIPYFDDWEGNLLEWGSPVTPPGHIIFPPADLGSGPVAVTFNPDGTPREYVSPADLYNWAPVNYLQTPLTRVAAGLFGHYELSERSEAYMEASFVRSEPEQQLAPAPAGRFFEINLDNPLLTPETRQLFEDNYACAPNLACIGMLKRLSELGPRKTEHERDYSRIVAGIRGELTPDWSIDGWGIYTKASSTEILKNDASASRLQQGLLVDPLTGECFDPSGGCAPLDLFGEGRLSAEGVDFIRYADLVNRTDRTQMLASVYVSGSPADTWAGPLDIAVGADWRSDEIDFKADDVLATGDTLGYNFESAIAGTEEVLEFYGEAVIPLASDQTWAQYMGLEVGARYSEHKHAGGVWTYKSGGEFWPSDGLRLRAMYQRSVRAPNSGELFEEQIYAFGAYILRDPSDDPCSASADPVASGVADKCVLQGLPPEQVGIFEATPGYPTTYISGGNPDLRPETGDTWTVGAVLSPQSLPNWMFTIDYFSFEVEDEIGSIDSSLICFDPSNTENAFCENLVRDDTGNVIEIWELTSNRGLLETSGIDTQIEYSADLPDAMGLGDYAAGIDVSVYWTHMLTNKVQENPATESIDCAGYFGWPCDTDARVAVYPDNRVTSYARYTSGPLSVQLTWRWIDGTDNAAPFRSHVFGYPDPDLAIPSVSDKHYLDLGFAYTFDNGISVRFGVNNLLETGPPQMDDAVWDINTYTPLYDVFGRSYFVRLATGY
jgi:outer membrane receptor protein involved in Fe transport